MTRRIELQRVSLNFHEAFKTRYPKALIAFWAVVAAVSLSRGVINALRPGQSQDFAMVAKWSLVWLAGANPYYLPANVVANYPPHAVVVLTPLTFLPQTMAPLIWSVANLGLAIFAGVAAFRIFNASAPRAVATLFCLLFLSWAGLRVGLGNGQFSLLIAVFGISAVLLADRGAAVSGILLGLSLMKPHLGVAFFLWFLLTGRFRATAISLVVVSLGVLVFAARLGANPIAIATDFLAVLRLQFGGRDFVGGATELRPLIHALIPSFGVAEIINLAVIIGLLAGIVALALERHHRGLKYFQPTLLQLTCLWSLLAVFHNSYDLILLVVVLAAFCGEDFPRPAERPRFDLAVFWFLQMAMVLEIGGLWWKLSKRIDLSAPLLSWPSHFNRVLCLLAFLFVVNRVRMARTAQQRMPAIDTCLADPGL